ncbi:hypothetical protein ABIE56_000237 [Luteibacter sp. 621]|uniref:hypothetical protein n=1 Tax=Luteibacter sp. 621 TaxID=3373916 RepID=UPI003D251EDC
MPPRKNVPASIVPTPVTKGMVLRTRIQAHQRFDRFVVQQCAVRRFRLEHAPAFAALHDIRHHVVARLHEWEVGKRPSALTASLTHTLTTVFELFETRLGRSAIRTKDAALAMDVMGTTTPLPYIGWVLNDEDLVLELLDVLEKALERVEQAMAAFNYFDYFTVLDMTTVTGGEDTYLLYRAASDGRIPLEPAFDHFIDHPDPTAAELDITHDRWFRMDTEPDDLDLALALAQSARPRTFHSPSIKVLDSAANPFLQNVDVDGGRTLYLAVSLNRAPVDIDEALSYYAKALKGLLAEENGGWSNVSGATAYAGTRFARAGEPKPMLRERDQFNGALLGLWCWDLTYGAGMSQADAFEDVRKRLKHEPLEELPTYLNQVGDFIGPAPGSGSRLDGAVTGAGPRRLGRRDEEAIAPPPAKPGKAKTANGALSGADGIDPVTDVHEPLD